MNEKFSVPAFAHRLFPSTEENGNSDGSTWYQELVEAIRREIAAPRGRTEEERQIYTDTLNRAVIGYPADRRCIMAIVQDLLSRKHIHRPPPQGSGFNTLWEAVCADVVGMNVLEALLQKGEELEEIQVVGTSVFEVRGGEAALSSVRLNSHKELERLQQNLVLFNGDSLHLRKRWAEVMLLDGSRVTMTGMGFTAVPTLTIRFFKARAYDLNKLAGRTYQTLTVPMITILSILLQACFNLVITGSTNSGKTTLIKALIKELPDHERLITIESRYELMIGRDFPQKNCVEYEIDEADPKHSGAQAFKLALRQSPKRVCHAEIRDEDANIYVRACTRGHDGSMTTVHVSCLEDAPEAIADMCMLDRRGADPVRLVRRITQYVTQVGLEMAIVGGRRKLVRIGEYDFRDGVAHVRDWVVYDYQKDGWRYPMDVSSKCLERIARVCPSLVDELVRIKKEDSLC